MGQSNYIAAALFIAFFVYITAKGSLSKYIEILTGGTFAGDAAAGATISNTDTPKAADDTTKAADGNTVSASNPLTWLQTLPHAAGAAVGGDTTEILDVGKKLLGGMF